MSVIVRIVGASNGYPTPHDGRYVQAWNPHTPWGELALDSTADPTQAKRWASSKQVLREYITSSDVQPKRRDGRPNRPLMGLSIEIEPSP